MKEQEALRRRIQDMAERSAKAILSGDTITIAEARKRSRRVLAEIASSRRSTKK